MKLIEEKIWLEVGDWEAVGYKLHTIIDSIGKERKSWRSITTTGKGREMLFRYDTLSEKHKALFAEAVKRFLAEQEAEQAEEAMQGLCERVLACVQVRPQDILYFREKGFVAEKIQKATLYARRAAWLRFLAGTTSREVRKSFAPLQNKEEFLAYCLPLLHADGCFGFRNPNLQYLKIRLVQWNKHGINSCIDGRNGKQNALKITNSTEKLLISILETLEKPTAMMVWEVYDEFVAGRLPLTNTETGEVYNREFFPAISYGKVQQLVSKPINEALYAMVHGSNLTYREKHGRYLSRLRATGFLSQVTCDDWDLPVDTTTGQGVKLYLFFDVATRHCVGYSWSWSKNTELFLNGLKNMMLNPALNGYMPYELQTESHLISTLQGGILKEGELFEAITVLPNNPMGKYAETDIRNLKYGPLHKDRRFAPYFKGRHYARREAWRLEKDKQGKTEKLAPEQIDGFLADLIAAWNKLHPASTNMHEGLLPQEYERLAYWLAKPIKTTYRNGKFAAQNKEWYFEDIDSVLPRLTNNELIVKFWHGVPYVYHQGECLGSALEVQRVQDSKLERTERDATIKAAFYRNQKKLDNAVMAQSEKAAKLYIGEQEQEEAPEETYTAPKVAMPIGPEEEEEERDIYRKMGKRFLENQKTA